MKNLIESAIKLVEDFFEAENITENTETIRENVTNWYNKSNNINDVETLAAAAITGSYKFGTSKDELLNWKEFYFPSAPVQDTIAKISNYLSMEEELLKMENFHIGEIEEAQRDFMWR